MAGSNGKRSPPVSYRPPKGREAEFARAVAASGLSTNAFITQAVFRSRNKIERALLAKLLGQAQQISDELHEAQLTGGGENTLALEEAGRALAEIRAGIMSLMERAPVIPFASQRRNGQDLATHLMNTHDNEHMELAQVRGAVAQDLHGAFAEWEAQAAALTRCRNYLYSLSVNPDPSHGQLSREQYLAYIDLVEEQLGLSGQPRAVVFHVKEGREHCHVVWSRIDVQAGKARHLAFDHDKLMMATRQFAAEHGIKLPKGYYNDEPGNQLSLYEKVQQDQTGLSLEERKAVVTDLWRRCDSAAAFVSALAENGYILATGKRPFLLVDLYGHVNALPKLIDDREVRTERSSGNFSARLMTRRACRRVEEAQALAAQHRQALEDFEKARIASGKEEALKQRQAAQAGGAREADRRARGPAAQTSCKL